MFSLCSSSSGFAHPKCGSCILAEDLPWAHADLSSLDCRSRLACARGEAKALSINQEVPGNFLAQYMQQVDA